MYIQPRKHNTAERGFTLVELIVSLAVFTVVVVIAVGALLSVIGANRQARTQQSAITNINFVLDDLSRSIRTGKTFHCGSSGDITTTQDCSSGDSYFAFEPVDGADTSAGDQVVIRLNNNAIEKSTDGGSTFSPITSPDVTVDILHFYVQNTPEDDSKQPYVLVSISGTADIDSETTPFHVQATVSQRFQPATIGGEEVPEGSSIEPNAKCPLDDDKQGRILINFEEEKGDNSVHSNTCRKYQAPKVIQAGDYTVTYVTFDNHCDENGNNCINDQPNEQSWVQVQEKDTCGNAGDVYYQSPLSDDIPANANQQVTKWEGQTIPDSSDNVTIRATPGTGSHIAVCAAFDPEFGIGIDTDVKLEEF